MPGRTGACAGRLSNEFHVQTKTNKNRTRERTLEWKRVKVDEPEERPDFFFASDRTVKFA